VVAAREKAFEGGGQSLRGHAGKFRRRLHARL
jgi:hypothetical protein